MTTDITELAHQGLHEAHQQPAARKEASPRTRKLFMVLMGSYGNAFASKFNSGEQNAHGEDKGMRAALLVWDAALSKYADDVVEAATKRVTKESPEFPPSLPQFEKVCEAMTPRMSYAEEHNLAPLALPAPKKGLPPGTVELKNDGKDWARRLKARHDMNEKLTPYQVLCYRQALGMDGRMSWQGGGA